MTHFHDVPDHAHAVAVGLWLGACLAPMDRFMAAFWPSFLQVVLHLTSFEGIWFMFMFMSWFMVLFEGYFRRKEKVAISILFYRLCQHSLVNDTIPVQCPILNILPLASASFSCGTLQRYPTNNPPCLHPLPRIGPSTSPQREVCE